MTVFRLGELFCGPGGLALGAIKARGRGKAANHRIHPVWANDFDKDSCDTYHRNISTNSKHLIINKDVRELDIESLPEIDAFAYGFPCNDFSIVGEQKGFNGKFGPLYTYGVKILNHFRPKFFLAENVGGIRSANEGQAFLRIIEDLQQAGNGYNLTAHLYRFEQYGVPQNRHRLIIVGIDSSLELKFSVPAPTTKNQPVSVREALTTPAIPKKAVHQELTTQSFAVVERLKYIKPGENAWNADIPARLQLKVKGAKLSQIYRRLDPKKPAYTLTGSGGGGTHGYHWKENRALTNRERARIQTFPDDFVFSGSKESIRKQIGMAVSPKMSEIIFSSILNTLAGVSYPSIEANHQIQSALNELSFA